MILQLTRPLVALDCETHDVCEPEKARIVELGFHIVYPDNRPPKRWVSLVNPEVPIAKGASTVHGITDVKVRSCRECEATRLQECQNNGCTEFKTYPTFKQLAANLAQGFRDCDYCGYNVRFDLRVLAAEFARAGVVWSYANARLLDAMHLWRLGIPRTLSDAVREFLGREPTQAHRALGDAEDAYNVALAQLERWPNLPRDLEALHALQFPRKPGQIDESGKFIFINGVPCLNFGKHRGKPMRECLDYIKWMFGADFGPEVKQICDEALAGKFPKEQA